MGINSKTRSVVFIIQSIVLILFGLYLIKDGVLKNFAFRDVSDELSDSKQIFETGLGLLGVFVITSTISFVLSILIASLEKYDRLVPDETEAGWRATVAGFKR